MRRWMKNLWFAICWQWLKITGATCVTKHSGLPAKRAATVFGEKSILTPNEEGAIGYSAEEIERMSVCCASCGRHMFVHELFGRVRQGEKVLEDPQGAGSRLLRLETDVISNVYVGCTDCLEMGDIDAIGRLTPSEADPFALEAKIVPFDKLMGDRLQYIP